MSLGETGKKEMELERVWEKKNTTNSEEWRILEWPWSHRFLFPQLKCDTFMITLEPPLFGVGLILNGWAEERMQGAQESGEGGGHGNGRLG